MNESGMFFVDATYDNSDAKCSRDDEIVLLIQNNCGEVWGRDDCCGNQRCICGCFPGRFGVERAVRALEALGIKTDLREDEDYDDSDFDDEEATLGVSVRYYNTDGKFGHDKMIRSIAEKCGGAGIGCGQDPETHVRDLAFDFGTEEEREAAREALTAAGEPWGVMLIGKDDDDEEPESTLLAVEYSRGDPWIPQELVALLTFDLCVGWQHVSRPDNDAILVDCRSIAAATYLKHKIDTGPLDRWVFAFFIPDEQPDPSVKD